jgi:hypothetical protein
MVVIVHTTGEYMGKTNSKYEGRGLGWGWVGRIPTSLQFQGGTSLNGHHRNKDNSALRTLRFAQNTLFKRIYS